MLYSLPVMPPLDRDERGVAAMGGPGWAFQPGARFGKQQIYSLCPKRPSPTHGPAPRSSAERHNTGILGAFLGAERAGP